jgi:DNA-directed RNA polymerase subunit RPC12/RpoP
MTDNPRKPFGGKGTMDGYRCELCGAWVEYRDLGKVLAHEGPLPHVDQDRPAVGNRPRCPRCQARVTVQRTVASRPGFEHWTLRCAKCGHIHEAQVKVDPK